MFSKMSDGTIQVTELPYLPPQVAIADLYANNKLLPEKMLQISLRLLALNPDWQQLKVQLLHGRSIKVYAISSHGEDEQKKYYAQYLGKKANKNLGESCSVVKLAQNLMTGEWVALKIIKYVLPHQPHYSHDRYAWRRKEGETEYANLKRVQQSKGSEEIIYLDSHGAEVAKRVQFMQLARGEKPNRFLKNYLPADPKQIAMRAIEMIIALLQAVIALQAKHFLHRDLKPHNMVYDGIAAKMQLIDFESLAPGPRYLDDHCPGTRGYCAPEACQHFIFTELSEAYSTAKAIIDAVKLATCKRNKISLMKLAPLVTASHPYFSDMQLRLTIWTYLKRMLKKKINQRHSVQQALTFFSRLPEQYALPKRKVGILDVQEYFSLLQQGKCYEALLINLRKMDEVWIVDLHRTYSEQYFLLQHQLRYAGVKIGSKLIFSLDMQAKLPALITELPAAIRQSETSSAREYFYVTAGRTLTALQENSLHQKIRLLGIESVKDNNVACQDNPQPHTRAAGLGN